MILAEPSFAQTAAAAAEQARQILSQNISDSMDRGTAVELEEILAEPAFAPTAGAAAAPPPPPPTTSMILAEPSFAQTAAAAAEQARQILSQNISDSMDRGTAVELEEILAEPAFAPTRLELACLPNSEVLA